MHLYITRILFLFTFFTLAHVATGQNTPRTLVFLGDSLTAGYGLGPEEAYPALIEKKLQAAGLDWAVVNAGVSGDTTAGGLRRLNWILRRPVAIVVIALGANDMLRGTELEPIRSNLEGMITTVKEKYPQAHIVLAGMRATPNLGVEYGQGFEAIYAELSKKYETILIPFLLEGVGGVATLNQADGIHPTADGQKIMADHIWKYLEPVVRVEEEN